MFGLSLSLSVCVCMCMCMCVCAVYGCMLIYISMRVVKKMFALSACGCGGSWRASACVFCVRMYTRHARTCTSSDSRCSSMLKPGIIGGTHT